jgi:2-dehydro-3-deoxygluconokinase
VALDTNYRARGWPGPEVARRRIADVLARGDLALPTLDDERGLFGDRDLDGCLERLHGLGVSEVAVKLGREGACVSWPGGLERVPARSGVDVVDSTGAGDAFDAAYLHARLAGEDPPTAAAAGNALAAATLGHRGAIAAR